MNPLLHSHKIESHVVPQAALFFLHGILGKGRNWQRFATELLQQKPECEAVLVDLRLHGSSQHFSPPHTVEACGKDIVDLVQGFKSEKKVLIGHSFGGKVALEAICQAPSLVSEAWIIDSFPGKSVREGEAWRMIVWLQNHQGPFTSRTEALKLLQQDGFSKVMSSWMATNLEPEGKELKWVFSIQDIVSVLEDYAERDLTPVLLDPPCPVHVVKGTRSSLITGDLIQKIKNTKTKFPVSLHEVEAGHWVHTDNSKALLELLVANLLNSF